MQTIKRILTDKKERMELVRYIVAGVLTTLLSIIISYGMYMLLSADHTINGANALQVMVGNTVSWIVCVLFAFWINRRMVFRVGGGTVASKGRELLEFVAARAVSLVLFEEGFAALLKVMGITNTVNRLIVLVLVTVFNYVASKFWIFRAKEGSPAQKADTPEP